MGLFDRFKKKNEEIVEEQEDAKEIEDFITPEEFVPNFFYGGVEGDDLEDRIEFDIGHGYYRNAMFPEKLYRMSQITGYQSIILLEGKDSISYFEDLEEGDVIQSIFVNIYGFDQTPGKHVSATFYDPTYTDVELNVQEAIEETNEFMDFLEEREIIRL